MNRYFEKLSTVVLLTFVLIAQGVSAESLGYVDFKDLTKSYGEPKVEINLGKAMMGFVGGIAKYEDPEVAELLSKLESVRVLVYNTKGDAGSALKAVDNVTKKIRKDNWHPIVSVNEENERIRIFAKSTNDKMDGLVVMVVDGGFKENESKGEVVFINIVGEISPENISKVTNSLNIDVLNN